jgi:hypothetical protein
MIDNPDQVERLFNRLEAALPLPARVTPELATMLQAQNVGASSIPSSCSIIWIRNIGDEGGIVCQLKFAPALENEAFVSLELPPLNRTRGWLRLASDELTG